MVKKKDTVYIGNRYIQKHCGQWDSTNSTDYEPLSVVYHNGKSYTSKSNVPRGTDITDNKFWVVSADYNEQVDIFKNEIDEQIKNISLDLTKYCVLDGVADDTENLINAKDIALQNGWGLFLPSNKTLRITRAVSLRKILNINFQGVLVVDFNGTGLDIGGDSNTTIVNQYFHEVYSPKNGIGIRIIGSTTSTIKIDYCPYVQLYADADDIVGGTSNSYNIFYLGKIDLLEITTNPTPTSDHLQWINENKFFGGRIGKIIISGTYHHNNNIFYAPTLETTETNNILIDIQKGISNSFVDCRFEGESININMTASTSNNIIECSYSSTINNVITNFIKVTDYGIGNIIDYKRTKYTDTVTLFDVNYRDKNINGTIGIQEYGTGLTPGINKMQLTTNWANVYESDFIPIDGIQNINYQSDTKAWRLLMYCYDSNKNLITQVQNPEYAISGNIVWNSTGYYQESSNVNGDNRTVVNKDGRLCYIKVKLVVGSGCPFYSSYIRIWLDVISYKTQKIIPLVSSKNCQIVTSTIITQSNCNLGDIIPKTTGGFYQCTFALKTNVYESVPLGSATIGLSKISGVAIGDIIGIQLDDGQTHWTSIVSGSGTFKTISEVLPSVASVGNPIIVNRWI